MESFVSRHIDHNSKKEFNGLNKSLSKEKIDSCVLNTSAYDSFPVEDTKYDSFDDSLDEGPCASPPEINVSRFLTDQVTVRKKIFKPKPSYLCDSLEDICSLVSGADISAENENLSSLLENEVICEDSLRKSYHQGNDKSSGDQCFDEDSLAILEIENFDDSLNEEFSCADSLMVLRSACKNRCNKRVPEISEKQTPDSSIRRKLFKNSVIYENSSDKKSATKSRVSDNLSSKRTSLSISASDPLRDSLEEIQDIPSQVSFDDASENIIIKSSNSKLNFETISIDNSKKVAADNFIVHVTNDLEANDCCQENMLSENPCLISPRNDDDHEQSLSLWNEYDESFSDARNSNIPCVDRNLLQLETSTESENIPRIEVKESKSFNIVASTIENNTDAECSSESSFYSASSSLSDVIPVSAYENSKVQTNTTISTSHPKRREESLLGSVVSDVTVPKKNFDAGTSVGEESFVKISEIRTNKILPVADVTVPKKTADACTSVGEESFLRISEIKTNKTSLIGSIASAVNVPKQNDACTFVEDKSFLPIDEFKSTNNCSQTNVGKITVLPDSESVNDETCYLLKPEKEESNLRFHIEVEIGASQKVNIVSISSLKKDNVLHIQKEKNSSCFESGVGQNMPHPIHIARQKQYILSANFHSDAKKLNDVNKTYLFHALDLCNKSDNVINLKPMQSRDSIMPLNLCTRDEDQVLHVSVQTQPTYHRIESKENIYSHNELEKKSKKVIDKNAFKNCKVTPTVTPETELKRFGRKVNTVTKIPIRRIDVPEHQKVLKQNLVKASSENFVLGCDKLQYPKSKETTHKGHHLCMIRNSVSKVPKSIPKSTSKKYKTVESPVAKYIKSVPVFPLKVSHHFNENLVSSESNGLKARNNFFQDFQNMSPNRKFQKS